MITVVARGISDARKRLGRVRREFPRKASRALNVAKRAAREAFIEAVARPSGASTLSRERASRLVGRGSNASGSRLKNTMRVRGDRIGAQHYDLRVRPGGGISVRFRPDESPTDYPYAFGWRGNWFQRMRWRPGLTQRGRTPSGRRGRRRAVPGPAPSGLVPRLPIFRIEGPRVTSMLARDDQVRDKTAERALSALRSGLIAAMRV